MTTIDKVYKVMGQTETVASFCRVLFVLCTLLNSFKQKRPTMKLVNDIYNF